jgi:M6 family metalloprotease-like protein
MRKILLLVILVILLISKTNAVPANPHPIKYTQSDGSEITIQLKGDEIVNWAETLDGYTLVNNGNKGWEYAIASQSGDIKASGVLACEINKRKANEVRLIRGLKKNYRFSPRQVNMLKSVWEAKFGSDKLVGAGDFFNPNIIKSSSNDGRRKVFSPMGNKKLLLILIQYPDEHFTYTQADFEGLMNTQGYSANNAKGSVRDFFLENSYNQFNLTTDVAPHIYTAANNMAYYGANVGSNHSPKASELISEAVIAANADGVDFSQYDNDGDGSVDGVYVIYAGYGEATSGIEETIWPHAGTLSPALTCDGKSVVKYSCSNELTYNSNLAIKDITTIGVICHEFGHVCGAPDYYDTDYETSGQFSGTGDWDLMCVGVYNGSPSGSQPAHMNPFEKVRANWVTPEIVSSSRTLSIPDITSNKAIYIYNTPTTNEYFMMENRQKIGFNSACPGHGLMIYHYSKTYWDATKNKTAPQGFYPVCASATTNPTTISDDTSYGNISSTGCPFPGSSGKTAFYDSGIPSSKSWAGANTGFPLTNIKENVDGTISLNVSAITTCSSAPTTQVSALTVTSVTYNTMNLSWIRGTGDKVIIVAREGSAVDFDPLNGTTYAANANFKLGDEVGSGNYVVYNGTGTTVSLIGLSGGSTYHFSVYEYNSIDACYLKPALKGIGTTNCTIDAATFTESFERSSFGCWTTTDNTGQGNWNIGTRSNANYTPALSGNYAYFSSQYGVAHSYNADLISPTFDLSFYTNVMLKYKHLFDASSSYASIGTVSYSIDNGATWTALTTYTSDSSNPQIVNLPVDAAIGKSQVKFKWNYTCSPTGAYMWAIDDIQVVDNSNNWIGTTSTDWFTATNWSTGTIPTSTTSVVILGTPSNQPQINASGAACMNITMNNGSSLTMNSGTAYTLSVAGDWTNNGTFTAGAGTVDFNGTNDLQSILGSSTTTFKVLSVSKGAQSKILEAKALIALGASNPLIINSGTFKLSSASTIKPFTTSVTIGANAGFWNNGGIVNAGAFGWTLNPGLLRVSAGTVNVGTSSGNSIIYMNLGRIIIEGGVLNVSGRISPYSSSSTGSYIQSGGTVILNTVGSASTTRAVFELNSAVPFTMTGGTIIVQNTSSNTTADVIIASTSNNVTGGTLQIGDVNTVGSPIIRINSTAPIGNLKVTGETGTGTPTAQLMTNSLTVKGDVTIGAVAKIDANSLNLSVGGNWLNNGGELTTPLTGTVTLNGATAQSIAGSSNTTFNNLTIDNTAGVTANSTLTTVGGNLVINDGKLLNVAPAKALTVNGTFTNNAGNTGFVLQSDATGTGTFLDNGTANTAVGATVQQYLPSVRNWYTSSPVSGATAPAGNTYYKYIEAANDGTLWTSVPSGSIFDVMTGYIVKPDAATTFSFSGALKTGAQQITGLTSIATAKTGFNLVGNPYPSYVNWMSAAKTNLSTTIWYRTQNLATTPAYVFDTYNETANTGTNNNGVAAVTGMIPPMQAFWVKVNAGSPGSLAFDNSMRSHQDVATNKFRAPAVNAAQQVLRLQVSNGTNSDEAIVLFNANAADGYDAYDSQKMTNANNSIPEIYTFVGTDKLVINGLNSITTNSLVPLGFSTGAANSFSIKASEVSNFDADTKIVLKDNMLKVEQDITDGTPYNFTSDVASMDNRFSVVFKSKSSTIGIDNSAEKETIIVSKNANNQIVVISNTNYQTGVVTVSNTIGQKLHSATITGITTVITKSFNPGVYLVTVNEGEKHVTKKVIIN